MRTPGSVEEGVPTRCPRHSLRQCKEEKNLLGRKPQVKWPKSCIKKEWKITSTDLSKTLKELKGSVDWKPEKMSDLITQL